MDRRKIVEEHLALAERHVREGMDRITRQQQVVRDLQQDGLMATAAQASALLLKFEESFALQIADRDRLSSELKQIDEA